MRNAAQRELVCSSWGCVCVYVCVSLWTGLNVYVSGLPEVLHVKDTQKYAVKEILDTLWKKICSVSAVCGDIESSYSPIVIT